VTFSDKWRLFFSAIWRPERPLGRNQQQSRRAHILSS